jgi:hypothetical protein
MAKTVDNFFFLKQSCRPLGGTFVFIHSIPDAQNLHEYKTDLNDQSDQVRSSTMANSAARQSNLPPENHIRTCRFVARRADLRP